MIVLRAGCPVLSAVLGATRRVPRAVLGAASGTRHQARPT